MFECVAKAKKKLKNDLKGRESMSLSCLWEDNIKRHNLNKSSLGCGQGPVAGPCGHGEGHSSSIFGGAGRQRFRLNY